MGDPDRTPAQGRAERRSAEEAEALWRKWQATGDARCRDRLIFTFAPLVKYLVYKKIRALPPHLEVDDLISAGLQAMMESLGRWDAKKGATLEQFLWTRIHGAILDELRGHDWAPRSLRRFERESARARTHFQAVHNRRPTREELADALGMTVDELLHRQRELQTVDLGSLNRTVMADDDTEIEVVDTIVDTDQRADPHLQAQSSEAKDKFRQAFGRLNKRDQELCVLLYVEHLTLREIGEVLGVSESRVSQLHTALRKKLRAELDSDSSMLAEAI